MKDFILNWSQKRIFKKIGFLKRKRFYLAGGTALALQLGHRTSKDLDFYTLEHFNSEEIVKNFKNEFGNEVQEISRAPDTIFLTVGRTDLSFFRYPYKLIRPLMPYLTVHLAAPEDIAAMKIEAVIARGVKRDFVDIYFLIEKFSLEKILKFTKEKYPLTFNLQNCLDALLYFKDAEEKEQGRSRLYLYSNISWREIKRFLEKEVKKYQLSQVRE